MAGASVASTPPRTLTAAICPRGWLPTSVARWRSLRSAPSLALCLAGAASSAWLQQVVV